MGEDKRPPRRPVVGSRHATSRPRTVAGRREPVRPEQAEEHDEAVGVGSSSVEPVETTAPRSPEPSAGSSSVEPVETTTTAAPRRTLALVVALVLLVGVAAAEAWYLWLREDPVVSADRPVVVGEVAHRAAVESARQSTEQILSYGHRDFEEQVEEATSLMTPAFAERFRETAADVEERFVRERTEQEVEVVAAGVVQASPEKVRALLFLDQYVAKGGEGTSVTPYRALVTVVRTDGGWLVDEIETQ